MKKLQLLALLIVAALISTATIYAASPRMILVEEATNWNCGPCAQQNPAFKQYINTHLHEVIPVIYHAWWPGAVNDAMYLFNTAMNRARISYYGTDTRGVPEIQVNGTVEGAPANIETGVAKWRGQTSPITITIDQTLTGKKLDISVTVASDDAINGKLRIVLCEQYIRYEQAGTNGEKDFYYVARQMFPNADGTEINIAAGGSETHNHSYNIDSRINEKKVYIVAYIQNDATKEVLQAGTNLKIYQTPMTVQSPYAKMDANTELKKTIKIDNPTSEFLTVGVKTVTSGSLIPEGWEATVSPESVVIDPNGSANVDVLIKAPQKAGFCRIQVDAEPINTNLITMPSTARIGALTNNTKYVLYPGSYGYQRLYTALTSLPKYANEMAIMPIDNDLLINYPPRDFEIGVFQFDYHNRGLLSLAGTLNSVLMPGINSMISNGKKVLIFSEIDIAFAEANPNYSSSVFRSFYGATLGLQGSTNVVPHVAFNDQGQIAQVYANSLTGVVGDEISTGLDIKLNEGFGANDVYFLAIYSDILQKRTGASSEIFLKYNNNDNMGAAVRVVRDDARMIYCSFDPKSIFHEGMRNELIGRMLIWLDKKVIKVQPVMVVSVSSLDFQKVPVNSSKEISFDIESKGSEPLEIKTLKIDWDDDLVYEITNKPPLPLTINPDQSYKVNVKFTPKEQKLYDIPILEIESNDPDNPYRSLTLRGQGEPVTVGPKIAVNVNKIEYGELEIGYTSDKDFVITNNGGSTLMIDDITIGNNSDGSFAIVDKPTVPFLIAKGATKKITIRFAPKAEQVYDEAFIKIESNDEEDPTLNLALNGSGKEPGGSSVENENINASIITLSAGPNPFSNATQITYSLNTIYPKNVTLTLVDQAGRQVAKLLDKTVQVGENTLEFTSAGYASGTYYLVARVGSHTTQIPLVIVK